MITEIQEYFKYLDVDKSPDTIRHYKTSIQKFLDYFKIEKIDDLKKLSLSDCRNFQLELSKSVSHASVNSYNRPIKAMLNWLVESEYIENSPMEKLKKLKSKKELLPYLEEEEVSLMINAAQKLEEKLIIAMLVSLGIRRNELVNIRMEDIDKNEKSIHILGKGAKEREVYFPDDVYEMFEKFLSERKDKSFPFLFRSKNGRKYCTMSIWLKVKRIAKMANIDSERINDISPHSFRRTFATNLVENGVDIRVIQGAMGHSSINTTMRYANLRNSAVKKAMSSQHIIKE